MYTLKVVSTYCLKGPTRWGIRETAEEAPAQLDYILATAIVGFEGMDEGELLATTSDHLMLGMTLCHIPKPKCARGDYFEQDDARGKRKPAITQELGPER